MSDDLRELYQEVILDHGRHPRNQRRPVTATHVAHGHNPLCGDRIDVYLTIGADGRIADVAFDGRGCAISVASASIMTEVLKGKTEAEARGLFDFLHGLCTGAADAPSPALEADADRLSVLSGVRQFPMRVKCATLAWHTFKAALNHTAEVSTEDGT